MSHPKLASTSTCTGCGACIAKCSRQAIRLECMADGFYRPIIDAEICIHCGGCTTACPVQTSAPANETSSACYTGWLTDVRKRMASSSGGAFTALAEQVLAKGGCVWGVALQKDMTAAHVCIEQADGLEHLRGSKYIPSRMGSVFKDVAQQLKTGRVVLFTGTPCEIAGLKNYLRKDFENLLTCDFSCHGVPSQSLFTKYLQFSERKLGANINSVQFRNKDSGWMNFQLKRSASNSGLYLSTKVWEDNFMQGFLSNACLKPSCYGCQYHLPHRADITLADAWGIHTIRPEWDHQYGISLILAHTEKGLAMLKNAQAAGALFLHPENEKNANALIQANEGLVHKPMPIPQRRKRFLKDLNSILPLPAVLDKHLTSAQPRKLRKDVGIIGLWMTCNYGAILTDFALYRLLQTMGYDPILLDHSLASGRIKKFMDPNTPFRQFLEEQQIETSAPLNTGADMEELNDLIDTFMVGSDQMWHIALWERPDLRSLIEYYMLEFVHPNKRKIAFATSFGTDEVSASPSTRQWEAALLHLFDSISVREDSAAAILDQYYGVQAPVVLDPVFLCERSLFDQIAENSGLDENKPYICSYVLDNRPEYRELEKLIAEKTGYKIIHLTDPRATASEDFNLNLKDDLGIPQWLYYISHCRYLITDSYHGICFAIIYNKPFTAIGNTKRGITRFESLLRLCGLTDRLFSSKNSAFPQNIEWQRVNSILDTQKKRSLELLHAALQTPRTQSTHQANDAAWILRQRIKGQQSKKSSKSILWLKWINAATRGAAHTLLYLLKVNRKRHLTLKIHYGTRRRELTRQIRSTR